MTKPVMGEAGMGNKERAFHLLPPSSITMYLACETGLWVWPHPIMYWYILKEQKFLKLPTSVFEHTKVEQMAPIIKSFEFLSFFSSCLLLLYNYYYFQILASTFFLWLKFLYITCLDFFQYKVIISQCISCYIL